MANYTQRAILDAFEELLAKKPFDKITVSAIVSKCEISSNTFYYHFRDIYDLLDTWLDKQKTALEEETADIGSWADKLKVVLRTMQKKHDIVYHIFDSISRERLEHYAFVSMDDMFYEYVKKYAEGMDVPDEILRMVTSFFCYSILGYFLKFLWLDMNIDLDTSIDHLILLFNGAIESVIQKNQK